jgi:chorismate--pyruvate lyase
VYLKNSATGDKLVYAVSWWSQVQYERYMAESSAPIWVNLQKQHAELYRAIERVYLGRSAHLEKAFAAQVS